LKTYHHIHQSDLPDSPEQHLELQLESAVQAAAEISGCPIAYVSIQDSEFEIIKAPHGFSPPADSKFRQLDWPSNSNQEPHISNTPHLHRMYGESVLSITSKPVGTFAMFPVTTNQRGQIGALCLADYHTRQFSSAQLRALKAIAAHIASQLTLHEQLLAVQKRLVSLEDSENRFRRIADASPVLLWISDVSGLRTLSNKAWCNFTGLSEEESLAESWRAAVHPDDSTVYQAKWVECVREQKRFQHEYRLRHSSGTFRWVLEQAIPMFLSNGRLEVYISSCVDLSLRSSDELQYQHNEARFRAVSEAAPLGIVVTDASGHCIYSNQKFQGISGLTPEESLGTGWLRTVHEGDRDEMIFAWVNAVNTVKSFEKEFRYQRADGSIAWCSLKAAAINSTDTVSGWVSTIEDITAKHESDQALVAAMHAAQEAMNAKNQFLANMSHEIRTPLTAIIGFADALREDGSLREDLYNHTDVILNNGRHLLTIINQILDLSKIDAGALTVESAPCDLMGLVDEMLVMFSPTVSEKSLYLNVSYDWPLPRQITTDPLRLKQVLINLLGNAIKFTARGGITLGVSWDPANKRVIFSISDTGIGISGEQLEKLFTPFYQVNESMNRIFGGTGLGLSISKRLVEALGGSVEVQSDPGKGSTFTFYIRTEPTSEGNVINQPPVTQAQSQSEQIPPPSLSGKILFADDALDNRRLVEHLLKKTGAQITLVENGQEAIDVLRNEQFDLILMDIQMPIVDGLTATRAIRKAGIATPIVAISAGAMANDIRKALDAGCSMHLSKPFERSAFYEMLTRFIQVSDRSNTQSSPEAIRSAVDDSDQEMAELIAEFVRALPSKLQELSDTASAKDSTKMAALAHKLKGSSGMYGFPQLSAVAKSLEKACKEQDDELLTEALHELEKIISRILQGARTAAPSESNQHIV
jgi:PAS domain S-box-containing protein